MNDQECVRFLQWALPLLQMRWKGFRRVRRQVCRRLAKRLTELGIPDLDQYKAHLQHNPGEWPMLDRMCRITISRFFRNKGVFDFLEHHIFPQLMHDLHSQNDKRFRIWSCGCASGEEPFTIALLWHYALCHLTPGIELEIIGTDMDPRMVERAETACYGMSSLRNVPSQWLREGFSQYGQQLCVKHTIRDHVLFKVQDFRQETPGGKFHMILCRNLAFTYYTKPLQQEILLTIADSLAKPGVLVTGAHENPSAIDQTFVPVATNMPIYRKA